MQFANIEYRHSWHHTKPFGTMKVRLKAEIIRIKDETVDPSLSSGTHVNSAQWATLLQREDVIVLDTRNDYEVNMGTFNNAINPDLHNFHEFPQWVNNNLPDKEKTVAMFCTGGIRCEKAAAYMKQQGFENVYQLQGGILNYFAETGDADNLWHGDCFVFDDRIAVDKNLNAISAPFCKCLNRYLSTEDVKFKNDFLTKCGDCVGV